METKWTPGPWEVDHEEGWCVRAERSPEGLRYLIADLNWFDGGEEEVATARLIAAAPELYQALEISDDAVRLQNWLEDNLADDVYESIPVDLWNAVTLGVGKAREAMAKARGKA